MQITAGTITQYQDIDAGVTVQRVPWEITERDEVLFSGNQSFPLSATNEEIMAFLIQCLSTHREDTSRSESSALLQADLDHAATVGEEISGLTINT